ncbi:hypothetical protein Tco_1253959 [Tanacetum coccineum]
MVFAIKDPLSFDELMATLIDFSKYAMNRLKIDNLTQAHLVGPVYELSRSLPRLTIAAEYFFNNDLEFLKSSDLEKKYTTSIMKTKAARYEIVGIEDISLTLWSATKVGYNKDAEKGIKHWGEKRQLWYRSQMNKFFKRNIYSTQKILSVVSVSVKKLHGYGHLEEIAVKRADRQTGHSRLFAMSFITDDSIFIWDTTSRKWMAIDKMRSKLMVELIDKQMLERWIIRNLERLVGARELEMDYSQNQRDLPRDIPLDRIEVLRTSEWYLKVFTMTMEILPEPTSNKLCGR